MHPPVVTCISLVMFFCNNQNNNKIPEHRNIQLVQYTVRNAAVRNLTTLQVLQIICVNASQPNVNARHIF